MSPYVDEVPVDEMAQQEAQMEQLMRCTQCEYTAPKSEFVPENYR